MGLQADSDPSVPQVNLPGGSKGSIFDNLEDIDRAACIAKCVEIAALQ